MREIEIKAKVRNKSVLLDYLVKQGIELGSPVEQRDQVFGVEGVDGGGSNSSPWLRIRTETKNGQIKQIFTLKRSITNQLDSIEHETEIADAEELAKIILHLSFTPYSDLTKTRQKALTRGGDIEICVDTIDGLGDFIEAEKLTDEDADYEAVVKLLWEVLEACGISCEDEVTDGYDVLMRKSQGLSG